MLALGGLVMYKTHEAGSNMLDSNFPASMWGISAYLLLMKTITIRPSNILNLES